MTHKTVNNPRSAHGLNRGQSVTQRRMDHIPLRNPPRGPGLSFHQISMYSMYNGTLKVKSHSNKKIFPNKTRKERCF